ncbi:MAG: spore coat U domain-containing protein [Pseudomonadota bacterium]|nr:spore coat U domain-containing protein [Pseudomonadota bacterium]
MPLRHTAGAALRRTNLLWMLGFTGLLPSAGWAAGVTCSVSATGPVFGTYVAATVTPLNSNGSVVVTCTIIAGNNTGTATPIMALSAGASASYTTRTMGSTPRLLNYNLYRDAAHTQVWGDGTGVSSTNSASISVTKASPTQQVTATIYGRIPASQDAYPNAYTDTIVVTVTY